jgi:hypothetical protein
MNQETEIKHLEVSDLPPILYQKDKRALPGNLQTENNVSIPPTNVVSLTTTPPFSLSLSLSLSSLTKEEGRDIVF